MNIRLLVLAIATVLGPTCLFAQVPVEVMDAPDTLARAYTMALKQAILGSGTFSLEESDRPGLNPLHVSVVVGGGVTCGDAVFRGVTVLMSNPQSRSDNSMMISVSVYQVGDEAQDVRQQLLKVKDAATRLGIRRVR